jgi:hypothetical protein
MSIRARHIAKVDIAPLHPGFTELLESRVFPPLVFPDEDNTVASPTFLPDGIVKSNPTLVLVSSQTRSIFRASHLIRPRRSPLCFGVTG